MSRTHMVYMGAALLVLLACVAITGCVDSEQYPSYSSEGPAHCANITIAGADYGFLTSPYYVSSTEPFTYATMKDTYYFAKGNVGNQVAIIYTTSYSKTGKELRSIISMSSLCCEPVPTPVCCKCNCCGCGVK